MTDWWAFKPVTTAFEKAKKLLLEPFNAWTWLKLMIIVFFVGSSGNLGSQFSNTSNYSFSPSDTANVDQVVRAVLSNSGVLAAIIIALIIIAIVVLVLAYLRNVFSFVLVEALASGEVHVLKPMRESLGRGLRLFVFIVAAKVVGLIAILVPIGIAILAILLAVKAGVSSATGIVTLLLAILVVVLMVIVLLAIAFVMGIFVGFTYDFVVPRVLFQGKGIVASWKGLWASIKKDWQQYGVYVITRWALELAVGIASLIVIVPVVLIFVAIMVLGVIVVAAAVKTSLAIAVLIGIVLLAVLAAMIVAILVVAMPIAVYFRYYSLDVLRQIDPAAVRYSERMSPAPPTLPA